MRQQDLEAGGAGGAGGAGEGVEPGEVGAQGERGLNISTGAGLGFTLPLGLFIASRPIHSFSFRLSFLFLVSNFFSCLATLETAIIH